MEPENFIDPIEFIARLNEEGIRYLLVGRQAIVQYGAPLQSFDFDFYLCPETSTLEKLVRLASDLKLEHERIDLADPPGFIRLHADNISFDFLRARFYTSREGKKLYFDGMWERRQVKGDEGFSVNVPCIADLIESKKMRDPETAEGRRDLEDLRYLEIIARDLEQ